MFFTINVKILCHLKIDHTCKLKISSFVLRGLIIIHSRDVQLMKVYFLQFYSYVKYVVVTNNPSLQRFSAPKDSNQCNFKLKPKGLL